MRTWLREAREKKAMTMKDISRKLDITESYYCCIENGERQKDLNLSLVTKLSEILGVSVNKIIAEENNVQRK